MVEGDASLTDMPDRRQRGPYAKLELKRWVFEDPARVSRAFVGWS
jgi:hypothetical protein